MKETVLITGGAGYIGSHTLINFIEHAPFNLVSVDNFSHSSKDTFTRIKQITDTDIKNYNIDLCNLEKTRPIFLENPTITGIIHFAAYKSVPESVENPLKYYHNNIISLVNLLQLQKEFSIPHFIFSSSCSVYGNIEKLPVNEKTPLGTAQSPYGATKKIGERIIQDFSKINPATRFVSLRYFNPIGAHHSGLIGELPIGKPDNLIPILMQAATGMNKKMHIYGDDYSTPDGTCIRDYVHVSDIAHAHLQALQYLTHKKTTKNNFIFNLGAGKGVSVLEAIQTFEKVSRKKINYTIAPRRLGDVEAIYSDYTLAKKHLGWKPYHTLETMIASAWAWQEQLLQEH